MQWGVLNGTKSRFLFDCLHAAGQADEAGERRGISAHCNVQCHLECCHDRPASVDASTMQALLRVTSVSTNMAWAESRHNGMHTQFKVSSEVVCMLVV